MRLMQAIIAEAAAREQAGLDLVSVDSATARAHHHAAGMVLDSELVAALREAAEQERDYAKGAKRWRRWPGRQRGDRTPAPATTAPVPAEVAKLGRSRGGLSRKVHLVADR
jgi:hypothetical protein